MTNTTKGNTTQPSRSCATKISDFLRGIFKWHEVYLQIGLGLVILLFAAATLSCLATLYIGLAEPIVRPYTVIAIVVIYLTLTKRWHILLVALALAMQFASHTLPIAIFSILLVLCAQVEAVAFRVVEKPQPVNWFLLALVSTFALFVYDFIHWLIKWIKEKRRDGRQQRGISAFEAARQVVNGTYSPGATANSTLPIDTPWFMLQFLAWPLALEFATRNVKRRETAISEDLELGLFRRGYRMVKQDSRFWNWTQRVLDFIIDIFSRQLFRHLPQKLLYCTIVLWIAGYFGAMTLALPSVLTVFFMAHFADRGIMYEISCFILTPEYVKHWSETPNIFKNPVDSFIYYNQEKVELMSVTDGSLKAYANTEERIAAREELLGRELEEHERAEEELLSVSDTTISEHDQLGMELEFSKPPPMSDFLFDTVFTDHVNWIIIDFIKDIWFGPRENLAHMTVFYSLTIRSILARIHAIKPELREAAEQMVADAQIRLMACGNANDEEDVSNSAGWTKVLSEALESMCNYESTPLHGSITKFFSFVASLPVLLSNCTSSETAIDTYKSITKFFSQSGVCFKGLLNTILAISQGVAAARITGNYSSVFKEIIDNVNDSDYINCCRWVRLAKAGQLTPKDVNFDTVRITLLKLKKKYGAQIKKPRATAQDLAKAKEVDAMLDDFSLFTKTKMPRKEPVAFSIVGPAGCGKSVLSNLLIELIHSWNGLSDVKNLGYGSITTEYHNGITNGTTMIINDDLANTVSNKRAKPLGQLALEQVNSQWTQLNKAELSQKENQFFNHICSLWIDNEVDRLFWTEMLNEMAGVRRMGQCWQVSLKEEYKDPRTGRFDPDRLTERYPAHLLFRQYAYSLQEDGKTVEEYTISHNINGVEKEYLEFHEWISEVKDYHDKHWEQQQISCERRMRWEKSNICPHCNLLPTEMCLCANPPTEVPTLEVDEISTLASGNAAGEISRFMQFRMVPTNTIEFVAAWIRLRTLGCGRVAIFFGLLINHYFFETLFLAGVIVNLVLYLLFSPCAVFVHVGGAFLFGIVLLRCFAFVRRKVTKLMLQPISESVNRVISFKAKISKHGEAAAFIVKLAAVSTACAAFYRYLHASKMQIDEKNRKSKDQLASGNAVGTENEVPTQETSDHVVIKAKKFDEMVQKAPWAPISRVRPVAPKQARTISEHDAFRKYSRNLFVSRVNNGSTSVPVSLLFLSSTLAVTVSHVFTIDGKTQDVTLYITDHANQDRVVEVEVNASLIWIKPDSDLAFLYLPAVMGQLPKLTDFVAEQPGKGPRALIWGFRDPTTGVLETMDRVNGRDGSVTYSTSHETFALSKVYCYNAFKPPVNGVCGSFLFSSSAPRSIEAMHVASDRPTTSAYAMYFTRGDVRQAEDQFRKMGYIPALGLAPLLDNVAGTPTNINDIQNPTNPACFMPADQRIEVAGNIAKNHLPRSGIVPNPHLIEALQYMKVKAIKVPPKMRWRETFAPIILNSTACLPLPDGHLLEKAVEDFKQIIPDCVLKTRTLFPDLPLNRPFSLMEAINGISGTPFGSMKKGTSAGFPSHKKKKDFLVTPDGSLYFPTMDLVLSIMVVLGRLKDGLSTGQVETMALKDELKKMDKVCRGFCSHPISEHLANVMYEAGPMQVALTNNADMETAIGLNRLGPQWNEFLSRFHSEKYCHNCFDLDFRKYDTRQSPLLRMAAGSILVETARQGGWSPAEIEMLEMIISSHQFPAVAFGDTIIHTVNLLLSGIFTTALLNGYVGCIVARYDFYRFCESTNFSGSYSDHRVTVTLGDDQLGACSTTLRDLGWTPEHLMDTGKSLGMEVTTADKSENAVEFKHFADTEFLQSSYNYQQDLQLNVHVVGPKSYLKSFIGCLPGPEHCESEYQIELCENALLEAFYGGRKAYDHILDRVSRYLPACGYAHSHLTNMSYEDRVAHEKKRLGEYEPQRQAFAVTEKGIEFIEEYSLLDDSAGIVHLGFTHASGNADAEQTPSGKDEAVVLQDDTPASTTAGTTAPAGPLSVMSVTPDTSRNKILERRIKISQFTWTTLTNTRPMIKLWESILRNPLIRSHLRNVALVRANLEVVVEVSAPSTSAGSMLISLSHFPAVTEFNEDSMDIESRACLRSQRTSMVVHAGNGDGKAIMSIPYVAQHPFITMRQPEDANELASLNFDVIATLTSATQPTVVANVIIYAALKNVLVTGATSFEAVGNAEPDEKFSKKVSAMADLALGLSSIPGLGMLELPAEIAKRGAGLMHHYGYSQPLDTEGKYVVPTTTTSLSNGRNAIPARVLSVDPSQNVSPSGAIAGLPDDEMAFAPYTNKWNIVKLFHVNSLADQPGTEVCACGVTPIINLLTGRNLGGSPEIQPTSISFVGNNFSYWNGSMEYRLNIIAPLLIAGWLRISYEPFNDYSGDLTAETNERIDINLKETRDVTFQIHWHSHQAVLHTVPDNFVFWDTRNYLHQQKHFCNGHFTIEVLAPLQGSTLDAAMKVSMILEARAHTNMKFFDYKPGNMHNVATVTPDIDPPTSSSLPVHTVPRVVPAQCSELGTCGEVAIGDPLPVVQPTPEPASPAPTQSPVAVTVEPTTDAPSISASTSLPTNMPTSANYSAPVAFGANPDSGGIPMVTPSGFSVGGVDKDPSTERTIIYGPEIVTVRMPVTVRNSDLEGTGKFQIGTIFGEGFSNLSPPSGSDTSYNVWIEKDELRPGAQLVEFTWNVLSDSFKITGMATRRPQNYGWRVLHAVDMLTAYPKGNEFDSEGTVIEGISIFDQFELPVWNGVSTSPDFMPLSISFSGSLRVADQTFLSDTIITVLVMFPKMTAPIVQPNSPTVPLFLHRVASWQGFGLANAGEIQEVFHIGTPASNDIVLRGYAGEMITSFRVLLNIATPAMSFHVPGKPNDISQGVFNIPMYAASNASESLLTRMMFAFLGFRGGVVVHFHCIGHGAIAVSRASHYLDNTEYGSEWGGVEICDTQVNPFMSVKVPYYSPTAFLFARGLQYNVNAEHWIVVKAWAINGPLQVNEYWSRSEDFSLIGFRGAPSFVLGKLTPSV